MTELMEQSTERQVKRLTFSSEAFDNNIYHEVAQRARLLEVSMVESNYSAKVQCFREADETGKALKNAFSGKPNGHKFHDEAGIVVGGYEWLAEIKFERSKALKLKVNYMLVYGGLTGRDASYVQLYFEKVARFTTYPYFRSHFAMLSANSGLALAPLPSLTDRVD